MGDRPNSECGPELQKPRRLRELHQAEKVPILNTLATKKLRL